MASSSSAVKRDSTSGLRHLAHRLQVAVAARDDLGGVGRRDELQEIEGRAGCKFGLLTAELSSIQLIPPLPSAGPELGVMA